MGRQTLSVTVDTNVLLRAVLGDDLHQQHLAAAVLMDSDQVIVPIVALCEFAWVLARSYRMGAPEVARSIRTLLASEKVRADRPATEAGLAMLDRGGDFADGVIAFDGRRLGGAVFVSFDRKAVRAVGTLGGEAELLA